MNDDVKLSSAYVEVELSKTYDENAQLIWKVPWSAGAKCSKRAGERSAESNGVRHDAMAIWQSVNEPSEP